MKLSHKVMSAAALAAVVSTAVVAAPPTYAAEQQAVAVDSVIVDVNGQKVVVSIEEYGLALLGLNQQLYDYLKDGKEVPVISALHVGEKYVDLTAYGTELLLNDGDTTKAAEVAPAISTDGFKEFKGFGQDGKPELIDIIDGTELKVLEISAVNETKISVKFDNNTTTEVELTQALVEGKNEVTFTVDGVEYTGTVILDKAAPTVANAEVADYQTLKVNLSEAMTGTPVVKVNGVEATGTLSKDGKSVVISKQAGYAAGTYAVTVSGLEDAAGNKLAETEVSVTKAASVVEKVDFATTGIVEDTAASNNNLVFFKANDQYNGEVALSSENTANLAVSGTINGVPFLASELAGNTNLAQGKIEVNKDLKKGDKVTLKVTNTIGEETVEVGTVSYTVGEAAAPVATTISNLVANYSGSAANGHTVGNVATEVLASDEVTLAVDVKNQLGNPFTGTDYVRWVVESGAALITKANGDAITVADDAENTFTFKAANAGNVVISAYLANGQKVTYNVAIGAKKLDSISAATFTTPYNKEEATSAALTITDGAVLKASDVKFQVTSTPEGATANDIQLVAVDGTGDNAGKVYVKATTQKAGTYKFKAYVGESFDKATTVASESTITTTVNQTVAKIEVAKVAENEFQVGASGVVKAVKFFNKHDEQVNVTAGELATVPTAGLTITELKADAEGNAGVAAGSEENVAFLKFATQAAGSYTANIVAGPKSLSVPLTAVEAGKVKTITLGSENVSVIKVDKYDAESDTDKVVVVGGKAYTLIPVSAKDSYGVDVALAPNHFSGKITGGTNLEYKFFSGLTAATEVTGGTTGVKYIGVYAPANAETSTITVGTTLSAVEGFAAPTKQITVKDSRSINTVALADTAVSLVPNGTVKKEVVITDNYGVAITDARVLGGTENTTAAWKGLVDVGSSETTKATVDLEYNDTTKKLYVVYKGVAEGSSTVTVSSKADNSKKATANVTVGGNLAISSVKFDAYDYKVKNVSDDTKDQSVDLTYKVNDGSVEIPAEDLTFIHNDKVEVVKSETEGKITVKAAAGYELAQAGEEETQTITVLAPSGVSDTITLTFSDVADKVNKDTIVFGEDMDEDASKDGVQVIIGADEEGQVANETEATVVLTGTNQYGEKEQSVVATSTWVSSNNAVASISGGKVVAQGAKGKALITGVYDGKTVQFSVEVTEEVAKAVTAAANLADAQGKIAALTTAAGAGKNLTVKADLEAAEAAVTAAKTALDKVDNGVAEKAGLVNTFNTEKGKVETARATFDVAAAKTAIEGLNIVWATDVATTVEAANTAIAGATLPEGVTATAAEGTVANAGKVVITISKGDVTDTSIVIAGA